MSFNNFNGVMQGNNNKCGAYALAAALDHVRNNMTCPRKQLNTNNISQGYSVVMATPFVTAPAALAQGIYETTGNLTLNPVKNEATYAYANPVDGTNPPSALVYIASQFGLGRQQLLVCYTAAGKTIFENFTVTNAGADINLLATETDLITPYGNVNGPLNYTALPAANEAHLMLVNQADHWIVITNNQCYDPGSGTVGPYTVNNPAVVAPTVQSPLTQINFDGHVYPFSGLWIRLS
jgi:hypothetical protein